MAFKVNFSEFWLDKCLLGSLNLNPNPYYDMSLESGFRSRLFVVFRIRLIKHASSCHWKKSRQYTFFIHKKPFCSLYFFTLTEYPDSSLDSLSQGAWLIDKFPNPLDSRFTLLFSFLRKKSNNQTIFIWILTTKRGKWSMTECTGIL